MSDNMGKPWPSIIPTTRVAIELTQRCNLDCVFCYQSEGACDNLHIDRILNNLSDSGVMEIMLTGGEPSLIHGFYKILEKAHILFPRVLIQSNGVAFADRGFFQGLSKNPPFCLNFSLHGPEEIHEKLTRVKGSFYRVHDALCMAVESGIRTASNIVLNRINAYDDILFNYINIIEDCGCREITVTRFIATGKGKNSDLEVEQNTFWNAVHLLKNACEARNISFLLAHAMPLCHVPEDLRHICNRCSYGYDKFYVDVQGNLLSCGMGRQFIGNILEKDLREVLLSSHTYKDYISLAYLPKKCKECDYLSYCGGGCRAAALAKENDYMDFYLVGQEPKYDR